VRYLFLFWFIALGEEERSWLAQQKGLAFLGQNQITTDTLKTKYILMH